jgi:hypothetical protein
MAFTLQNLHNRLVAGSLKNGGTWGGVQCRAHVGIPTHLMESTMWVSLCLLAFKTFRLGDRMNDLYITAKINQSSVKHANKSKVLDNFLAAFHFLMYSQLIYYKWNISSLINLVQPCHLILLLEGIALASDGPLGVIITTLILPSLSGTFLAILFPDTTGLDQAYEEKSYWIQHYLIITIPVYLLQRRNGLAFKMSSYFTISFGLWILVLLHFSFFEVSFKFYSSIK